MDSINTLAGPVNAAAFTDESATAYGAAIMAEVAQLVSKTNEVIGGLTTVASDLDTEEASTALAIGNLTSGLSDLSDIVQTLDGRVDDAVAAVDALNAELLAGHLEVSSGDKTLASDTERTVNFTGTGGLQSLTLPTTLTDFTAGQKWTVVCNNANGVQISSSNWAHSSLTAGTANLNLLVGNMAIVSVVSVGGTKKWNAAKLIGAGGYRAAPAGGGDLGAVDEDDRNIWVDRTGDTDTRDLYLPEAGSATAYTNDMREITLVLYGNPSSGSFVVHCQGTDTFLGGATTHTAPEKAVCRYIGNGNGKWAVLEGKGL